jgi:hypothetical protein
MFTSFCCYNAKHKYNIFLCFSFILLFLFSRSTLAQDSHNTTKIANNIHHNSYERINHNLPDKWRLSIVQGQDVLIFYPDATLPFIQSKYITAETPAVKSFIETWQLSFFGNRRLLAVEQINNFVYLASSVWPSEFIETDFPDLNQLPLPDSVATTQKEYKTITVFSPWLKMKLYVSGDEILGVQIYHNLTKLLSWQDDFFVYNLQHSIISRKELDIEFGSDKFFRKFPLSSFSKNAFILVDEVYKNDFLHQFIKPNKENLMNSFKDKNGYDLELISYAFLLSVTTPQPQAVKETFAMLPSNCSDNNALNDLIYKNLLNEINLKLKKNSSTLNIIVKRKEIYSRIEKEFLQNPALFNAIGKQSCFNKL